MSNLSLDLLFTTQLCMTQTYSIKSQHYNSEILASVRRCVCVLTNVFRYNNRRVEIVVRCVFNAEG